MRICIDLDGTICEIRKEGESYSDVKVKPGAAEKIKTLKEAGHTIIINTARNMLSLYFIYLPQIPNSAGAASVIFWISWRDASFVAPLPER